MPTILSHPAVPLALGAALSRAVVSTRLLFVGVVGAILPDLDVLAFALGVPRGSDLAHRGFTHSLFFAACYGAFGALCARCLQAARTTTFVFLFVAMGSHGVLDAFTDGGSGVALFWPFSPERFFAPVQPIEVSPIGISRFMSTRGVTVLLSELRWIWLPCVAFALFVAGMRKYIAGKQKPG